MLIKIYHGVKHDVNLFNAKSLLEVCHYAVFEMQNAYRLSFIACICMIYNNCSWHRCIKKWGSSIVTKYYVLISFQLLKKPEASGKNVLISHFVFVLLNLHSYSVRTFSVPTW